jgi:hypothetical protein
MLDIVENAIGSGASVVTVDLKETDGMVEVSIGDNGSGMSPEVLAQVRDPFYTDGKKHSSRKVGLGLPFVEQASSAADGQFDIRSEEGTGTSVFFSFNRKNIDCPPLGDLSGSVVSMMIYQGEYELLFSRSSGKGRYVIARSQLVDALGTLEDADAIILARRYIGEREEEIA